MGQRCERISQGCRVSYTHVKNISGMAPRDRLAISRRAILQCMNRNGRDAGEFPWHNATGSAGDANADASGPGRPGSLSRLWRGLSRTTVIWWRSHPAHLAADVVKPVLGQYARANPLTLLGVAAGLGAAVVLARPWRLIPVTGLLMTMLKSRALTHFIASALMPGPGRGGHPR